MTGRHSNTLKWIHGSWKCAHWVKVTCGRVVVNYLRNTERTWANGETHLPNAEKRISSSQEPVTCSTGRHDRSLGSKDTASWVWLAAVIQGGPGSKMGCFLPDVHRRGTSEKLSPMDSEHWLHCLLFFFSGNKIKTAPRDLSSHLLISMWTMRWNPRTQHWLSPRELLKMQLSTNGSIKSCWSQHTELISESNKRISYTL